MVRSEGDMSLKNPVTPPGIDPRAVRLVAQRLNYYATPDPLYFLYVVRITKGKHCKIIYQLYLLVTICTKRTIKYYRKNGL